MFKKFILLPVIMITAGCYTVTPPEFHDVVSVKTVDVPKDVVFQKVTKFFALNNIKLKTIEPRSGVIYAENNFNWDSSLKDSFHAYADCGKGAITDKAQAYTTQLNVFVEGINDKQSQVTISTNFMELRLVVRSSFNMTNQEINCTSRGLIEARIFEAITQS